MSKKFSSFSTTAHIDIILAAQLAIFWEKKGMRISSRNQLIRESLEALGELITKAHPDTVPRDADFAIKTLQEFGLYDIHHARNKGTLLKELQLDSLGSSDTPFNLDEAAKILEEQLTGEGE